MHAAPFWRRLAAIVYDLLAVIAIVMVVGLLAQMATGGRIADEHGQLLTWWYQPVQGLVVGAYFFFSWLRGGQTLGMRPWRIRVTDREGRPLTWQRAAIRLVVAALPIALLTIYPLTSLRIAAWAPAIGWAILLAPALFDARRRAIYDMVAGTEIRPLTT
ncbi:RDD family protein [Luteibacter rhizovicinus]|uniref:RDD family protein n=1 Tax=Luteibacter rhizovicinus TaxID=242606 RepID=A0A4R3YQS6_9GAMM|nr:RDD family protein [Luteibacter rhizovicinus]TCV93978.1 RDD family protein [Luteibacter rhizovicinus]